MGKNTKILLSIKKESDKRMTFQSTRLEEEKEDIISVRLNAEERALVDSLKKTFNVKSDSKALKIGAFVGKNVIHNTLGEGLSRYLFKNERAKSED